jgi:hypothetical protein
MTDKKEQGRKRKAVYDAKQKANGRGRLEITPPPKIENHARIKRYAAKVEAEAEIINKPEDW